MTTETKISELTVGELIHIIRTSIEVGLQDVPPTVKGIEGIASIFGVSTSTAKRIKASGVINEAISQSGKVIVTDVKRAKELYHTATHGRKKIGYK